MTNKCYGSELEVSRLHTVDLKLVFPVIILFFLLIVIYGNSLNGAWQFDDDTSIVNNQSVHLKSLDSESIGKTFYGFEQKKINRPVAYLSFGLNHYFSSLDPFWYHVVNLIIHYLAAIFLFLFVNNTLNLPRIKTTYGPFSYPIALLTAFFWAVNPVQVTAVTYIVQRMASMAGLFYILSLYLYLIGRTSDIRIKQIIFFLLSLLSALLAIGSKENAFMLPVCVYLYDLLLIQDLNNKMFTRHLKYFILPSAIALFFWFVFFIDIYSITAPYSARPFTLLERLLTEPRVILFYISLLLYPTYSRLMLTHDFTISRSLIDPWTTGPAILIILGCLALAVWLARKRPLISYCIIFFFLNHFIESSFIPLELLFEYRNYIPSMLFFLLAAILIIRFLNFFSYKKGIQLMIMALICIVLIAQGHTVFMYNSIFRTPYILWSDNVRKAPNLSRPYGGLGNALWNQGRYREAYDAYEKAWTLNRFNRFSLAASAIYSMGRYHFLMKNNNEALAHFETAIKIRPHHANTSVGLAQTQIRMDNLDAAEETIRQSLVNNTNNVNLNAMLSFIMLKKKAFPEAINSGWKTLMIDPEFTDVRRVLAETYNRIGLHERAIQLWEDYLDHYPDDLEGCLALIDLYAKTGKTENLDGMIGKIMAIKEGQSWRNLIDEYQNDLADHAFEPDSRKLLAIIRTRLKNQQ
jgi:tetratricopeptide (TPR) repeat protein